MKTKGFTLIELLVVIAIILSSVVLASLNTARNKGECAKGNQTACAKIDHKDVKATESRW